MPDYADRYTDRKISDVDKRLRQTYRTAQKELKAKLDDFNRKSAARDKVKQQELREGKISEQQYKDWLAGQVFIRKQWENKVKQVSQVMTDHNRQAMNIINTSRFDVFAENYNYNAFQTEKVVATTSFNLYSAEAVARLMMDEPQLLPEWKVDKEKDYKWNSQKVNNIVTQGIIQGESIDRITKRLCEDLSTQNENRMRMFARTAMTGAENAGRQRQMHDSATRFGIVVHKVWEAAHDSRTRDWHRELDGQEVPENEMFVNSLGEIEYPGDPGADPANVYNCRCTMKPFYPEYEDREEANKRYEEMEIDGQSYEEWKQGKKNGIEEQQEKTMGSANGIIETTSKYNDKVFEVDKEIKKLEQEYEQLSSQSLLKFIGGDMDGYNNAISRMNKIDEEVSLLREKEVEIQADRSRYLSEKGEKDIRKYFGGIRDAHNAAIDAKAVNNITGDPRTQQNCAACALAFDARRRGIDCKARLSFGTNNGEIKTWWEGMEIRSATSYFATDAREEVRDIASKWGEGARGIVQVDWSNTSGHTFAFEVIHGRCEFIDPQTGAMNADDIFDTARPGSVKYARTDDKEMTKAAIFGLRGADE